MKDLDIVQPLHVAALLILKYLYVYYNSNLISQLIHNPTIDVSNFFLENWSDTTRFLLILLMITEIYFLSGVEH